MWIWYILVLMLIFIAILVVRTFSYKPTDIPEMKKKHDIDEKRAVQSLSEMIQFKTVSYRDASKMDESIFKDFRTYVQQRYPLTFEKAQYSEHERGMLFKLKGASNQEPSVLMSHYDVVPVTEGWQDDPFSGRISEKSVYGRGTLDTKNSLCVIMEAVEYYLSQGKTFKNDLYLAFAGDEEISGPSAPAIVDHLIKEGVTPQFVLDEGGAIIANMFPGVSQKTAVIGIAEKGYLDLKLTARSRGGHASNPPKETPLTELATAIKKLNNHKAFKLKMTFPVQTMFNTLGPNSKSFMIKLLFANLWIFMPLVKMIAKKKGGEFLAMFKTTQAFTMTGGSDAMNVLPNEAWIGINYRLRPDETSKMIIHRVKKIINNPNIEVTVTTASEATSFSKIDDKYNVLSKSIKQTWGNVITTPYLMFATTDSRHYHPISEHVYKFSPMDVTKKDLAKIHGYDEDITIENVINGVNFYINLIEQL
jgi:carboxypeptidase PM20D1